MNSQSSKKNDGRTAAEKILDMAYGSDAAIEKMTAAELSAHLHAVGINSDHGWEELQGVLKIAEGKARLAAARTKRLSQTQGGAFASTVQETKEAIIEQIKGLISLTGGTAVYARKWEDSSVEDLKSLRDELVRTTGRAAKKKQDEQ